MTMKNNRRRKDYTPFVERNVIDLGKDRDLTEIVSSSIKHEDDDVEAILEERKQDTSMLSQALIMRREWSKKFNLSNKILYELFSEFVSMIMIGT